MKLMRSPNRDKVEVEVPRRGEGRRGEVSMTDGYVQVCQDGVPWREEIRAEQVVGLW